MMHVEVAETDIACQVAIGYAITNIGLISVHSEWDRLVPFEVIGIHRSL